MKNARYLATILALLSIVKVFAGTTPQSTFLISNEKENWHKAVEYCYSIGMRLAEIDDQSKEDKLKQVMLASNIYKEGDTVVWIGASDQAEEDNYHWHDSGRKVVYSNWGKYQPDKYAAQEHCVEFGSVAYGDWSMTWQWNDLSCSLKRYFACERN